jgi:hypothetical protein
VAHRLRASLGNCTGLLFGRRGCDENMKSRNGRKKQRFFGRQCGGDSPRSDEASQIKERIQKCVEI